MPNVTISLDESIIKAGRAMAERQNTSLNGLIRALLERQVNQDSETWLDDFFSEADKNPGHSGGAKWTREELYRE